MAAIRRCRADERAVITAIINAAAEAYRGMIPMDCWHEPYMTLEALESDNNAGVEFWGYESDERLLGIMGFQHVADVDLIRHAYVLPHTQHRGVGTLLLGHLQTLATRRLLVGTWAAASWAIRFYQRHGFELVPPDEKRRLLKTYWTIPDRQIDTSVVLAKPSSP